MKTLFKLVCAGILSFSLIGCNDKKEEDINDDTIENTDKDSDDTNIRPFKIGETATVGDVEIVVNSTRTDEGTLVGTPDEGKIYFVVDVTVTNLKDDDLVLSSVLYFSLKDADGRKLDQVLTANFNGTLDGTIPSKDKLTGEIAFETDPDGELNLIYSDIIKSNETAVFEVR